MTSIPQLSFRMLCKYVTLLVYARMLLDFYRTETLCLHSTQWGEIRWDEATVCTYAETQKNGPQT